MRENVIIIGASHAGVSMAAALRSRGLSGAITLIDREAGLPVERPPLSKAWLAGGGGEMAKPLLRSAEWYGDNNITLMTGTEVAAIDPAAHTITLADGEALNWDALVLATGGVARAFNPGGDSGDIPIHTLRTPADAMRLSRAFDTAQSLAVIGGGYIGLEVAAAARRRGLAVTICEAAPRLLARVASPPLAAHMQALHEAEGAEVITAATITGIAKSGKGAVLNRADGDAIESDIILAGIGMLPDTRLADAAGLVCDNGIVVDDCYRARLAADGKYAPDIFAIGDVARRMDSTARIESVHHAAHSADIAAAALMGETPPPREVPWFWSDQYDAALQSVGLVPPPDTPDVTTLTRKGAKQGAISFWTFAQDSLVAVEAVSDPRAYMVASRLLGKIAGGDNITISRAAITDPVFDLKSLLR